MTISPLADHPETIPMLARWFFDEWHKFDGRSRAEIEAQLSGNLNRDRLPITFVAHEDADLLGTVSLDLTDFPPLDHLSPWLASLYVDAPFRGRGVGRALVGHLQRFASSSGIGPLHLWTPGSPRLYERCGWIVFALANCKGQPVRVMSFGGDADERFTTDPARVRRGGSRAGW